MEIGQDETLAYEGEIYVMLGDVEPPELPQEHLQLAREFEHLRMEVDEFFHFDKVMDSGILVRVRDIKQAFNTSFYHPHVLSNTALYNAFFGRKFDELFAKAASDIKSFAQTVQQSGGSMHTRLNDEVTVQQLADLQGDAIHDAEYGRARDQLRKVAEFKKVVDIKRKGRYTAALPIDSPAVARSALGGAEQRVSPSGNVVPISSASANANQGVAELRSPASATAAPVASNHLGAPSSGLAPNVKAAEDHKIASAADMIRHFIIVADKSFSNLVPLRNCSLLLTPGEVDAFRNSYLDEKSFRADFADLMRQLVGTIAAIMIELEDYRRKKNSAYLWKQHADSLTYLLEKSNRTISQAKELAALCERRGLAEKVRLLDATVDRLRKQMQEVAKFLQG
jgi:hypothetical protein